MGTLQAMAAFKGFATGAGLIIAIGAQNAFVLTQGLRRQYPLLVAGLCSLIDAVLIIAGISGLGLLISESPTWASLMRWGGVAFLLWYGWGALRSAMNPGCLKHRDTVESSVRAVVMTTLAVSVLNPHVYLDTVVLMGSIGGQYAPELRFWFGLGAALASFTWFFSLSLGAKKLAPLFERPAAWRVLDSLMVVVMWGIALSLAWPVLFPEQ